MLLAKKVSLIQRVIDIPPVSPCTVHGTAEFLSWKVRTELNSV